jgi:hypothetical protein
MSYVDPFDAATQAGERLDTLYGRVDVSATFVKLVKGVGKQVWIESDGAEARRTEVQITLNPLDATGLTLLVERRLIAESRDWSGIVWPSLRDLGLKNVRELNGKWVKAEMVKTGRTYTNKRGDTSEETTFKFLAVYNTNDEATAAYFAARGGGDGDPMAIPMGAPATNISTNGNGNAERETALQFVSALVKQAGGDRGKLAGLIAQMPLISKYFTVDSPEVADMLAHAGVR